MKSRKQQFNEIWSIGTSDFNPKKSVIKKEKKNQDKKYEKQSQVQD